MGYYEPVHPEKNQPAAQSVFQSVTNRGKQESTRQIIESQLLPAPGTYDRHDGFDISYESKDLGTRQFKNPISKKIVTVNLHNPHAPPEEKKNEKPGPASYTIKRDFDPIPEIPEGEEDINQPRLGRIPGGKIYVDDNLDRFGLPLRPLKPIEMKPGPGAYFEEGNDPHTIEERCLPIEDTKMG